MSADRIKSQIVFTCDGCDDILEPETDNFVEANGARREAGWSAMKRGDTWDHFCPDCQS